MKIFLYQDNTLNLNLDEVASGMSAISDSSMDVHRGSAPFSISGSFVQHPQSYKKLSPQLLDEAKTVDYSICFTKTPYDNNYFFHASDNIVIVSFYAWEQLTPLPVENGVVYFIASLVRFKLPLPSAHKEITGCINDFLWNKTGIDVGMRSGTLCDTCKNHLVRHKLKPANARLLSGLNKVLHDMGAASRSNENIVDYWNRGSVLQSGTTSESFNVFICHNSQDKPEVRKIAQSLKSYGVRTWLDEEQLRPGLAWQEVLEEQISKIETVAVFVGSSGIGPWQNREIRAFLSEFDRRTCPVIPVILPDAEIIPELPIFLRQMTWVDFRKDFNDALERLVWGITGRRP